MRKNKWLIWFITLCMLTLSVSAPQQSEAFSDQVIEMGAYGDDVLELQARLQYIGFYKNKIDGKFGYGTYWALRNFQEKFGLPVDGVAGQKTKSRLAKESTYHKKYVKDQINKGNQFTHYGNIPLEQQVKKGTNQGAKKPEQVQLPAKYSEQDLQLMANAVYGESRGEPYEGQVAVAAVILNRVEDPKFPNTVSGVIFQPRAFTAVADGQIWLTPNARAKEAVLDALNGWDPTENALYYFNPDTATSDWIWSRPQIKTIGKHIFCE
ncbi:spore cortex-lytic enzyme [Paenisporosarcina sp. FSL H8-0542]|uniref:spore cortex-lytic enzyme n=1 Tax=unclassified Paenisporosarcina TaxID=2642018 RepID=UPI00034E9D53|nr:spore cortex-lytic enzyme [Paenisporosarcina sp. HGH0030]EPD53191.1 spore cortex-lytic enzyme [Paenisporosarcina sp. HGH0030]